MNTPNNNHHTHHDHRRSAEWEHPASAPRERHHGHPGHGPRNRRHRGTDTDCRRSLSADDAGTNSQYVPGHRGSDRHTTERGFDRRTCGRHTSNRRTSEQRGFGRRSNRSMSDRRAPFNRDERESNHREPRGRSRYDRHMQRTIGDSRDHSRRNVGGPHNGHDTRTPAFVPDRDRRAFDRGHPGHRSRLTRQEQRGVGNYRSLDRDVPGQRTFARHEQRAFGNNLGFDRRKLGSHRTGTVARRPDFIPGQDNLGLNRRDAFRHRHGHTPRDPRTLTDPRSARNHRDTSDERKLRQRLHAEHRAMPHDQRRTEPTTYRRRDNHTHHRDEHRSRTHAEHRSRTHAERRSHTARRPSRRPDRTQPAARQPLHESRAEHRTLAESLAGTHHALRKLTHAYLAAVSTPDQTRREQARTILTSARRDLRGILAPDA